MAQIDNGDVRAYAPTTPWRVNLQRLVDGAVFQNSIVVLICLNAVVLGMETMPFARDHVPAFLLLDRAFIVFFLLELVLRILAYGRSFFRSSWNIFDFLVIIVSSVPHATGIAAFRAFRILRVLRVVTAVPRMRTVVRGLLEAIPGILSVAVVAMLIIYIFAVLAATWFGEKNPEYFGDIFTSMYTLFQIITMEGWRDIADDVGVHYQHAWLFFIVFILVGTFTMLNLFIAIVVRVVEEEADDVVRAVSEESEVTEDLVKNETVLLMREIATLTQKIDALDEKVSEIHGRRD